jgi:hypothetical protein
MARPLSSPTEVRPMETDDPRSAARATRRYRWPWLVLAAIVAGIVLAFLWLSYEIEYVRRVREANTPSPAAAPSNAPAK